MGEVIDDNQFDIFQWANWADANKKDLLIDLFIFNKNFTPYVLPLKTSTIEDQMRSLFLYDMINFVETGAAVGLSVRDYATNDQMENVLLYSELESIQRADTLIYLLGDDRITEFNEQEHELSGANLSGADLRDAAIYYSDGNFDVNYRRGYFLSLTNLEEIETEMHHDVTSCRRWSFTWKNVLRIKSWKLKPAAGSFEAVAKNASAASKAIADGAKSQADEKCAQSETPEIEVGDRVAFKHGDEPIEALCGDVIAIKGRRSRG